MDRKYKIILVFIIPLILIIAGIVTYKSYFPAKKSNQIVLLPAGTISDSIVVYKELRAMEIYYKGKRLRTYEISLGKNPVGHKEKEGDKKTPIGLYKISGRNPNSKYHLSLRISYPNESDINKARSKGLNPGGDIMIHGLPNNMNLLEDYYLNSDWTDGCIAVSNEEIEELWNVVPDNTPIFINY